MCFWKGNYSRMSTVGLSLDHRLCQTDIISEDLIVWGNFAPLSHFLDIHMEGGVLQDWKYCFLNLQYAKGQWCHLFVSEEAFQRPKMDSLSKNHYLYHLSVHGPEGTGADLSCDWARGRVLSWQVASLSQGSRVETNIWQAILTLKS